MKTALFVTDCSIDAALSLRNWLRAQGSQPIRLTVVFPYDIARGQALTRNTLQPARADALTQLSTWSALLDTIPASWLTTETLLASPELATAIHLLLRSYDYWLVNDTEQAVSPSAAAILRQRTTQTRMLSCTNRPEPVMA